MLRKIIIVIMQSKEGLCEHPVTFLYFYEDLASDYDLILYLTTLNQIITQKYQFKALYTHIYSLIIFMPLKKYFFNIAL